MQESTSSIKVLFSSAGRRVELIRCFQTDALALGLKLQVIATDMNPELSSACQAADKYEAVPPCSDENFITTLLRICESERVKLLVPTIDPELELFAAHKAEFAEIGTQVVISSLPLVRLARNKTYTAHFLQKNKIPVPRTGSISDLLTDPGDWTWPVILKPAQGSASVGVYRANGPDEVTSLNLQKDQEYTVQEWWSGDEYTVNMFFGSHGDLCAAVPHLRYEVRGGEVSKGITKRHPLLIGLAERLAKCLESPYGPLCFQAIMNSKGEAGIIELNARFGGGYPLAHKAGACFSKWLLEHALDLKCSANNAWTENTVMLRYDAAIFTAQNGV